ncbi:MAG: hypothetical protein A2086_04500 [Spirochaetes bacterium GWD1_27_9]|nr:MAG: hypothetical protein A2Z98_03445 [Spirochaetes bacterium GWB1_27_13]OHD22725.1 MAG: hypothetical protein A2Y34_00790 [Spirochaetes bacterium GWC1_27_15]OHD28824.1 MAG: hypothetical protein A2086_04500 [Spirochaetes bacterium GWD1_27_9]
MTKVIPFIMLFLRLVLFAIFQALIALFFLIIGSKSPWNQSEGYWIISGLLTNFVTFYILIKLYKKEGIKYFDNFKFVKKSWWKDLLITIGLLAISMPLATFPNIFLANTLMGSAEVSFKLFFRPLPLWVILMGFLWTITQGLVELPTYFSYIMPRIEKLIKNSWVAWILASLFLALQHISLPLIINPNFIIWRFGMFFLFAFFIGFCLKIRPQLFPYIMISHALMDSAVVIMLLTVK